MIAKKDSVFCSVKDVVGPKQKKCVNKANIQIMDACAAKQIDSQLRYVDIIKKQANK